MCFGNNLKGDDPSSRLNADDNNLNSRPVEAPPSRESSIKMPQNSGYAPPSGPPPSHRTPEIYTAPSGPSPSHETAETSTPPPVPLPSHSEYVPPPGPPSFQEPYHDWQTAVPDTSLLPPPPSLGNDRSSANNATAQQAEQGHAWCIQHPITGPITFPEAALEALAKSEIGVIKPRTFQGTLDRPRPGVWAGKTKASCPDSTITSTLPLYSVIAHSPLRTYKSKTIYYEIRIARRNRREVTLAMGFAAPPYPTFRLPGWHRASLAVHGDDGNKYVNNDRGGKDFTQPFKAGETLGIGMTFTKRDWDAPPVYNDSLAQAASTDPINVEVFFTRDGSKVGSWNLHEEGDAEEDLPVTGLEGFNDLYAAVGTFENVEFEIVYNQGEWMYRS